MANNMLTAEVKVVGTRPILWHHFGPDAIPLEKVERTGVAGHDPEEWRRTVLMTEDRQLYIEPTYVFGCLREAARYTKKGRGNIKADLSATLQIDDEVILLPGLLVPEEPIPLDKSLPVYMDIRSVVNPSTKGRNVRYRVAAAKGWKLTFHLLWDRTIVNRNQLESVCRDAGNLVGLGNGREIGFGRFRVESFIVVD